MNVIGLDPGLNHTGWGILSIEKDIRLVGNGVIKTNNKETPGQRSVSYTPLTPPTSYLV